MARGCSVSVAECHGGLAVPALGRSPHSEEANPKDQDRDYTARHRKPAVSHQRDQIQTGSDIDGE
jgi:hypothetical protein